MRHPVLLLSSYQRIQSAAMRATLRIRARIASAASHGVVGDWDLGHPVDEPRKLTESLRTYGSRLIGLRTSRMAETHTYYTGIVYMAAKSDNRNFTTVSSISAKGNNMHETKSLR